MTCKPEATKPSPELLKKSIILKGLQTASKLYQREVSDELIEIWMNAVTETRPKALMWAFNKYFEREKFFPTPGHIYEYLKQWHDEHHADVIAEQEEKRRLEYLNKRSKELAEKGVVQ